MRMNEAAELAWVKGGKSEGEGDWIHEAGEVNQKIDSRGKVMRRVSTKSDLWLLKGIEQG